MAVVLTHEVGSAEAFRIYDHVHVQNRMFSLTHTLLRSEFLLNHITVKGLKYLNNRNPTTIQSVSQDSNFSQVSWFQSVGSIQNSVSYIFDKFPLSHLPCGLGQDVGTSGLCEGLAHWKATCI